MLLPVLAMACTPVEIVKSDRPVRDSAGLDTSDSGSAGLPYDTDGDGIRDAEEGPTTDTDGDGLFDYEDTDSDNDGIPDETEAVPRVDDELMDTDGDGLPDYVDSDSDADGIPDLYESTEDWDGDGTPNYRDPTNEGTPDPLSFVAISTAFNSPIGIDSHDPSGTVVMSVNYPDGNPTVLELVWEDGTHETFSTVSGLTDEVKIATVRTETWAEGTTRFEPGELFVGNGVDGQIVRIGSDGSLVSNPWVDLDGSDNGLMRGSLYIDRTGVFDGDLVVVTTNGEVWRIDSDGAATLIVDLDVHLEGLATVPDAPVRYGPLAGQIIAGSESEGLLYAISATGTVTSYSLGVNVEDIEIITGYENFFGVNYGTSQLLGVDDAEWRSMVGDILLTQESVTNVGLFLLRWDGSALAAVELQAAPGSATIGQWEHVTFAGAGIGEIGGVGGAEGR